MISKHCGHRLIRVSTDLHGNKHKEHKWYCDVCFQYFTQRLRKAEPKSWIEFAGRAK